jgi:hypothetical protein
MDAATIPIPRNRVDGGRALLAASPVLYQCLKWERGNNASSISWGDVGTGRVIRRAGPIQRSFSCKPWHAHGAPPLRWTSERDTVPTVASPGRWSDLSSRLGRLSVFLLCRDLGSYTMTAPCIAGQDIRRMERDPWELVAVKSWTGMVASPTEMSRFFSARGIDFVHPAQSHPRCTVIIARSKG